jgi:hypothetical protein
VIVFSSNNASEYKTIVFSQTKKMCANPTLCLRKHKLCFLNHTTNSKQGLTSRFSCSVNNFSFSFSARFSNLDNMKRLDIVIHSGKKTWRITKRTTLIIASICTNMFQKGYTCAYLSNVRFFVKMRYSSWIFVLGFIICVLGCITAIDTAS